MVDDHDFLPSISNDHERDVDEGYGPTLKEYIDRDIPCVLWHYTTSSAASNIIITKELRLTQISAFEQFQEFDLRPLKDAINNISLMTTVSEELKLLAGMYNVVDDMIKSLPELDVFVSSFTELRDSKFHWEHFGRNSGCSLGFRSTWLMPSRKSQVTTHLRPCIYDLHKQGIIFRELVYNNLCKYRLLRQNNYLSLQHENALKSMLSRFKKCFLGFFAMFKDEKYKDEIEWRVIMESPRRKMVDCIIKNGGKPYVSVAIPGFDVDELQLEFSCDCPENDKNLVYTSKQEISVRQKVMLDVRQFREQRRGK